MTVSLCLPGRSWYSLHKGYSEALYPGIRSDAFWAYLLILLSGLFVLISLHLLVESHDLRPFIIPLLIISVLQLFMIVFRYVFDAVSNGWLVFADLTIFIVMVSISALMLMHIGILAPLRYFIDELFSNRQEPGSNGNSRA
jgi:hypothetical protein